MPQWVEAAGLLVVMGIVLSAFVYGVVRLTAGSSRRFHEATRHGFYQAMRARGQAIALPQTWESEGYEGHVRRTSDTLGSVIKQAFALTAAVFVVLAALREPFDAWWVAAEAALGLVVFAGLYFGLLVYEKRRVRKILAQVGSQVPRTAFKVVANAHGLFVPIEGRILEGAWSDWSVTDADVVSGKGGTACQGLTLAHRREAGLSVPLVASMFDAGDRLLEVIAARAERTF